MGIKTILDNGISKIMNVAGNEVNVNLITYVFNDSDYDEPTHKSINGSVALSGLVFPVKSKEGSTEAMLMEQGKITYSDKVLYTGSVNISGNQFIDINGINYTIIPDGVMTYSVGGETVYNKFFIREGSPF